MKFKSSPLHLNARQRELTLLGEKPNETKQNIPQSLSFFYVQCLAYKKYHKICKKAKKCDACSIEKNIKSRSTDASDSVISRPGL